MSSYGENFNCGGNIVETKKASVTEVRFSSRVDAEITGETDGTAELDMVVQSQKSPILNVRWTAGTMTAPGDIQTLTLKLPATGVPFFNMYKNTTDTEIQSLSISGGAISGGVRSWVLTRYAPLVPEVPAAGGNPLEPAGRIENGTVRHILVSFHFTADDLF